MTLRIVYRPLTNQAYGFPRGQRRRVRPVALACIHITGNSRTANNPDLHEAALAERNWANRAGSRGPSAHDYIARDGYIVQAIDGRYYAAWSNGDVESPNTRNAGIRRVLALRAKGYNANEAYWYESENVGYGSSKPITIKQREAVAERIATYAKRSGLPINRETVHGHWEINGVDRRNCPISYASRETFLADIISRARIHLRRLSLHWGSDIPADLRAVATVTVVAAKLRCLGVSNYGNAINMVDLQAGFKAARMGYGGEINPVDLKALLRAPCK